MSKPKAPPPGLEDALDLDVLQCDIDDVDAELRAQGVDPEGIAAWGTRIARKGLEDRRLGWQLAARKRLQDALSRGPRAVQEALPNDRGALLAIVGQLRGRMGTAAEIAFRKREAQTADTEELKLLIEELLLLEELQER